jgi:hypothetical protein
MVSSNGIVRYPWDKWLGKKQAYTLQRGRDFNCKVHGMAAQLRNAASKRGMSVSIAIEGDSLTVQNKGH